MGGKLPAGGSGVAGCSPGGNWSGTTEVRFTARSISKRRLVSEKNIKILDVYEGLNKGDLYHPHHRHQMEEVEVHGSV